MTLSEDYKDRLYRHLRGQDTLKEKIEFREILRDNEELERIYYELKEAHFDYTPESYSAFLQKSIAEATRQDTPVSQAAAEVRLGWFAKTIADFQSALGNISLPVWPQPQYARLAFLAVILLGAGWSISVWQHNRYESHVLENFGNAYGPSQGSPTPDACGIGLKNKYYLLSYEKKTALQNISSLNNEAIDDACKAYYLGRSYLSLMDYDNAIKSFAAARASADARIQEMATFDLALSYILNNEDEKGLETLNSRLDWSDQIVVDDLKKRIE